MTCQGLRLRPQTELPRLDRPSGRTLARGKHGRPLAREALDQLPPAVAVQIGDLGVVALAILERRDLDRLAGEGALAVAAERPGVSLPGEGDQVRVMVPVQVPGGESGDRDPALDRPDRDPAPGSVGLPQEDVHPRAPDSQLAI